MDFQSKKSVPNPYERTNPISKGLFLWIFPFIFKGSKQNLELNDIYDVRKEDSSSTLSTQLLKHWEKEKTLALKHGKKPKLYKSIIKTHWKLYSFIATLFLFMECVLKIGQLTFFRLFIKSFEDGSEYTIEEQFWLGGGISLCSLMFTMMLHLANFQLFIMSMKIRVALTTLIYQKSLTLDKSLEEGEASLGHVLNLIANDVYQFDSPLLNLGYIIVGPVQMIILTYILYNELGVSCLPGIGFVVMLMPLQYFVGKYNAVFRLELSKKTDKRARFMNEIITGIKVIKLYGWEKPFSELIHRLRLNEIKSLKKLAYLQAINNGLYQCCLQGMILLTIIVYLYTQPQMTAEKIFFAVTCYVVVIYEMLYCIPYGASGIGSAAVVLRRIETYLLLKDKNNLEPIFPQELKIVNETDMSVPPRILLDSVSASWNSDKETLKNINVEVSGNKLVMITGSVGSGKSSLLNLVLAELPVTSGKIDIRGNISYSSQEAWIFNGSIRQNILFGKEFEPKRYSEIVKTCGLQDDLSHFPNQDFTIIGERGVDLSGGQKARINLARAVYRRANLYLFDDPLSAVDTKICRQIFENCIKGQLDGTLRLLVTHQVQYLNQADYIVVIDDGKIVAQGDFEQIQNLKLDLLDTLRESEKNDDVQKDTVPVRKISNANSHTEQHKDASSTAIEQKMQEEEMNVGSVSKEIYWSYIKSSQSLILGLIVLVGLFLAQGCNSVSDWWLAHWTNEEELRGSAFNSSNHLEYNLAEDYNRTYMIVFICIVTGSFVLVFGTILLFYSFAMKININIHDSMLKSLLRAPIKFYESNSSGRILNRVTRDLGSMDQKLPEVLNDTAVIFLQLFGVITLVVVSNYYIIIPTVFVLLAFYLLRRYFVMSARAVKRIESISRSPLFTHLACTHEGISTIRALKAQPLLMEQFDSYQDYNTASFFTFLSCTRWFAIWLELTALIYQVIITFSFLILSTSNSAGNIGLAISQAFALNLNFQWGMRQSAETENLMTSVERALEYSRIQPEANLESHNECKPPDNWPKLGKIEVHNLFLSYGDNDVLQGISFEVKPSEKIGIVGRTGAGKSSIITSLFRIVEPRAGEILIDGYRTTDLGLHDLRKRISIIPQDPVLFSGTMRYNLDPFGQFDDNQLWDALEQVRLKDSILNLDCAVSDGGSNFSVGEKQLVCLARALLRKNKILVLDEATSNVDNKTDSFIQETIRDKFSSCTIITIAHRLNTVMDCDRILVLQNGRILEYDHPYILLQNPTGFLTLMAKQTGKCSFDSLYYSAAKAYNNNNNLTNGSNTQIDE